MPVEFDKDGNPVPRQKPLNGYNQTQRMVATIAIGIAVLVGLWVLGWVQLSPKNVPPVVSAVAISSPSIVTSTSNPLVVPTAITLPTVEPIPTEVSAPVTLDFILLGNDYAPNRTLECPTCLPVHSDAFIYIHAVLDSVAPRITMFSLPRELYIHVDGVEPDSKINQLYVRGGFDYVRLWSNSVLGVDPDAIIAIDMDIFESIVDDIGGIDVIAPQTFTDQCGDTGYTYMKDAAYHLDGKEATCYARMRWFNPDGYFARQSRHMDILLALFNKLIGEFKSDPLITSLQYLSRYYQDVDADVDITILTGQLADIALTYYSAENQATVDMYSLEEKYLELYPRPTKESPFLYKPIEGFDIAQWVGCWARQSEGCER